MPTREELEKLSTQELLARKQQLKKERLGGTLRRGIVGGLQGLTGQPITGGVTEDPQAKLAEFEEKQRIKERVSREFKDADSASPFLTGEQPPPEGYEVAFDKQGKRILREIKEEKKTRIKDFIPPTQTPEVPFSEIAPKPEEATERPPLTGLFGKQAGILTPIAAAGAGLGRLFTDKGAQPSEKLTPRWNAATQKVASQIRTEEDIDNLIENRESLEAQGIDVEAILQFLEDTLFEEVE